MEMTQTIEIRRAMFIGSPKCTKATPLSTLAKPGKYVYFTDYATLEDGIKRVRSIWAIHEDYVDNADFWTKSQSKTKIGYYMINNLSATSDSIGLYDFESAAKFAKSWEPMIDILDFGPSDDVSVITRNVDDKTVGVEMLAGTSTGKKSIFIISESDTVAQPEEGEEPFVPLMPPIVAAQIFAFDIYDPDERTAWVGDQDLLLCDMIRIGA